MFEEFLAHIPLHLGSHDMSLTADIIFAEALDDIHHKESDRNPRKCLQDDCFILSKKRLGRTSQNLRIRKIHKTDNGCTEKVNKKDRFVRTIVVDEFF